MDANILMGIDIVKVYEASSLSNFIDYFGP